MNVFSENNKCWGGCGKKLERLFTDGGIIKWYSCYGKQLGDFSKT
jgi:hypothetical protein